MYVDRKYGICWLVMRMCVNNVVVFHAFNLLRCFISFINLFDFLLVRCNKHACLLCSMLWLHCMSGKEVSDNERVPLSETEALMTKYPTVT